MTIKIVDNFLQEDYFSFLKENILGENFPWYFSHILNDKNQFENDQIYNSQFIHMFFYQYDMYISDRVDIVKPLFESLQSKAIIRCKANLTHKTGTHIRSGFHKDYFFPCKTSILYINTNNGYTEFDNGTKVESVENRLVTFDSSQNHSGVSCTDSNSRVVININYF